MMICNNLIDQVPKDFFEAEERNQHLISAEMKKVWYCEIELLVAFIDLCKKRNLKWMMIGGSLLGAVRHNGFIPWDDDIDVGMPRADYDMFLKYATDELPSHFFLQTPITDSGRLIGYAQLRNSNTSAIDLRYVNEENLWNQGIFIDIFPLDGVPVNADDAEKQKKATAIFQKMYRNAYCSNPNGIQGMLKKAFAKGVMLFFEKQLYEARESAYRNVPVNESKEIGLVSFLPDEKRLQWDKELFDELIDVDYEFITVKVPKRYDEVLTKQYGDWNKMVKGGAMHGGIDFNCEMPYKEYLKKKYGYKCF